MTAKCTLSQNFDESRHNFLNFTQNLLSNCVHFSSLYKILDILGCHPLIDLTRFVYDYWNTSSVLVPASIRNRMLRATAKRVERII